MTTEAPLPMPMPMPTQTPVAIPAPAAPVAAAPGMNGCINCSTVIMHYQGLYAEFSARLEELRILRRSQAEHESLVRELHALRHLFEQQRAVIEGAGLSLHVHDQHQSLAAPAPSSPAAASASASASSSSGSAPPLATVTSQPHPQSGGGGGLFMYLEIIAEEQRRRVKETHAAFDEKFKRANDAHAHEMSAIRSALGVAQARAEQAEAALAALALAPTPAPTPAPSSPPDAATTSTAKNHARLVEMESVIEQLHAEIDSASKKVNEQREVMQDCIDSLNADNERLMQENGTLTAAANLANHTIVKLQADEAELVRRLKDASVHLQETQRMHYMEQQELLSKRDALQVKLFETAQSVAASKRRVDDLETKVARQEIYVRIAHDMQALLMDMPDEPPMLVHSKAAAAAAAAAAGTGAASASKRKNKKK